MPTLKQYVDASENEGYYILANVGGNSPVTLQVSSIAGTILQKSGYKPEDTVPTKLVWSMYEIGLVYTNSSVQGVHQQETDDVAVTQYLSVSSELTQAERQRLLEVLRGYSGSKSDQIKQLIEELRTEQKDDSNKRNQRLGDSDVIGADINSIDSVLNDE